MTVELNLAAQQRAINAQNELANKKAQLRLQEQQLAAISRDLVDELGVLAKAQKAALKAANPAVDARVAHLKSAIADLKRREDVAARIVKAQKELIGQFLLEGNPSNCELIETMKDYEEAMAEAASL